ncbi:hypothetical protein D3C73_616970 [compost metagenome]
MIIVKWINCLIFQINLTVIARFIRELQVCYVPSSICQNRSIKLFLQSLVNGCHARRCTCYFGFKGQITAVMIFGSRILIHNAFVIGR